MTKTDLAKEYVEKYIDLALKNNTSYSKRSIAQVMAMDHPDVFKDVEDARTFVRKVTNAHSKRIKKFEDLERRFALMEQSVNEIDYKDFVFPSGYKKTLWISDIHIPFEDRKSFHTAINFGVKMGCNSIVILGDGVDFYGQSKWDKSPFIASKLINQREKIQDILELLQDTFGYVVYKFGNHEKRFDDWLNKASQTMPELDQFVTLDDYLRFDGCKVQFVEHYNKILYGKLNAVHGHEMYGGGGVHVAYNRLVKAMDNIVSAHSHVVQSDIRTTILGDVYGSWTMGCLCNLHPLYNPMNNWMHGFAYSELEDNGEFIFDNKTIINGKVF